MGLGSGLFAIRCRQLELVIVYLGICLFVYGSKLLAAGYGISN